jgi:hypothetical protein
MPEDMFGRVSKIDPFGQCLAGSLMYIFSSVDENLSPRQLFSAMLSAIRSNFERHGNLYLSYNRLPLSNISSARDVG